MNQSSVARLALAMTTLLGAAGRAPGETLPAPLADLVRQAPGKLSFYAKNLDSGKIEEHDGDEPVRTASTIKLPIMVGCFALVAAGKLSWREPLTVTAGEKVSGSGVVRELSDGVQLPVIDLVHLMIVVSDNTATNLVLERVTGDRINAELAKLDLQQTRVMRKILGDDGDLKPQPSGVSQEGAKPENKKWGIGRSTPREMVRLLESLYGGKLVSREASDQMVAILKRQQYHDAIGRDLRDVPIASKSGALDKLRSDVGIVYTGHGAIAIAATVDGLPEVDYTPDNAGNLYLARLASALLADLAAK